MNVSFRRNNLCTEEETSGGRREKDRSCAQESAYQDHFCGLERINS